MMPLNVFVFFFVAWFVLHVIRVSMHGSKTIHDSKMYDVLSLLDGAYIAFAAMMILTGGYCIFHYSNYIK